MIQNSKMLVLIVDSYPPIIERLADIVSESENITAIYKAASYEQARTLFTEYTHHTLLLDIDLPGNGSIKLLQEIKKITDKTLVIILYTHIDKYIQEQCRLLGVEFFFDKYYQFENIPKVIDSYWQHRSKLTSTSLKFRTGCN